MNIELKKIKVHDDISEETMCFSAEIWGDGKKIGTVENGGKGACNHYWFVDKTSEAGFYAWVNTIEKPFTRKDAEGVKHTDYIDHGDEAVSTLVEAFETQKAELKMMKSQAKKGFPFLYRLYKQGRVEGYVGSKFADRAEIIKEKQGVERAELVLV